MAATTSSLPETPTRLLNELDTFDGAVVTRALEEIVEATKEGEEGDKLRIQLICGDAPEKLVALLQNTPDGVAPELIVEAIAELSKNERFRDNVGEAACGSVVGVLSGSVADATSDLRVQCLRAAGNLCYYNEKNRGLCRDAGLSALLCDLLAVSGELDPRTLQITLGVTGNYMASEEAAYAQDLFDAGMLPVLCEHLGHESEGVQAFALKAIGAMWFEATREDIFHNHGLLERAEALSDGMEDACALMELLGVMADASDTRVAMMERGVMALLMKHGESEDHETAAQALQVMSKLAMEDACVPAILAPQLDILAWLGRVARTTTANEVRMAVMLVLGNVGRTPETCASIVEYGFLPLIIGYLALTGDDDIYVQHAALGLLRNLALTDVNRELLRDEGIIELLMPILESHHQPMQFNAAAIIRHVVRGHPGSARTCAAEGALVRLLELSVGDALNVKMESSRAVVFTMFAVAGHDGGVTVSPGARVVLDDVNDADRVAIVDTVATHPNGLTAIAQLLCSEHAITQLEGCRAVALLAANGHGETLSQHVHIIEALNRYATNEAVAQVEGAVAEDDEEGDQLPVHPAADDVIVDAAGVCMGLLS